MPQQILTTVENNFVGGLKTEYTGLNFPENSVIETNNCVFTRLGRVQRRRGIDKEDTGSYNTLNRTGASVSSFVWLNAAGDGVTNLLVEQVGTVLRFYEASDPTTALSGQLLSSNINLTAFAASGTSVSSISDECQYATGNGYLFVFHPHLEPFYVAYDTITQIVTATAITVEIRDLAGITEGTADTLRPGSLTNPHKYNLGNQGWLEPDHFTEFQTVMGVYPSNADVWWSFKGSSGNFSPLTAGAVANVGIATAAAPKGHYIVSAFNIDRTAISGVPALTAVTTGGERPATGAFHAGRLFYSGIKSTLQHNNIYFSQIIQGTTEFGRCYQQNDPSAEDFFDLLPDDGGVITIQGAGSILKLIPYRSVLIVFATNGIWSISGTGGTDGLGFAANDYSVNKLSIIKCLSATSFVEVQGTILWWNLDGIYSLTLSSEGAKIDSITNTTISAFYNTIPNSSKQYARGAYNPLTFIVEWIYRSTTAPALQQRYEYDSFLCLNTLSQAFYNWSVPASNSGITINGIAVVETPGGSFLINNVVRGADNVVDNLGNQVIVNSLSGNVTPIFKYIISKPSGATHLMSFGEEYRTTYKDWESEDSIGSAYDSFFVTGYSVHGEAQKFVTMPYINIYEDDNDEAVADSAYSIQGIWDFASGGNSGKFSAIQIARIPSGSNFAVNRKRFRIRGKGMALQLRFANVENFPFSIIGWSKWETKNATP